VVRFVGDSRNVEVFRQPWASGWIWTAGYLALTFAVFLAGAVFVARFWRAAADRRALALVLQFLFMTLVWIAWQTAGQITLNVDYFAFALIPSCFIALAGILSRGWPDWCERYWPVTVVATALCLLICLTVDMIPGAQAIVLRVARVQFAALGALFLLGFALVLWRPAVVSIALMIVTFAYGNRLGAGASDYLRSDSCKIQPAVYGAIVDAASWLMTDADPVYTRARIWFDENEIVQPLENCPVRLGHVANSIATMASMAYVASAFPLAGIDTLPDGAITALIGDRVLVIIASSSAHLDAWDRRLAGMGLSHVEIQSHRVPMMASGFTIHAWSINPAAQ
jgi:hypothetical protein